MVYGDDAGFRMLTEKITRDRGFRCSSYKDKCLRRRVAVRMRAKQTTSHAEYASILDHDPREYDRLIRSLTVNVTKFFRNWDTYSVIEKKVIPALWERSDEELRVWSAASWRARCTERGCTRKRSANSGLWSRRLPIPSRPFTSD